MKKEFLDWYKSSERSFHCGHFDNKEIAYAAWLEGKKRKIPSEDDIINTILDCVYIRGIDLENHKHEFTNERCGLIDKLNKLYDIWK